VAIKITKCSKCGMTYDKAEGHNCDGQTPRDGKPNPRGDEKKKRDKLK
jgi:rubredoxin